VPCTWCCIYALSQVYTAIPVSITTGVLYRIQCLLYILLYIYRRTYIYIYALYGAMTMRNNWKKKSRRRCCKPALHACCAAGRVPQEEPCCGRKAVQAASASRKALEYAAGCAACRRRLVVRAEGALHACTCKQHISYIYIATGIWTDF